MIIFNGTQVRLKTSGDLNFNVVDLDDLIGIYSIGDWFKCEDDNIKKTSDGSPVIITPTSLTNYTVESGSLPTFSLAEDSEADEFVIKYKVKELNDEIRLFGSTAYTSINDVAIGGLSWGLYFDVYGSDYPENTDNWGRNSFEPEYADKWIVTKIYKEDGKFIIKSNTSTSYVTYNGLDFTFDNLTDTLFKGNNGYISIDLSKTGFKKNGEWVWRPVSVNGEEPEDKDWVNSDSSDDGNTGEDTYTPQEPSGNISEIDGTQYYQFIEFDPSTIDWSNPGKSIDFSGTRDLALFPSFQMNVGDEVYYDGTVTNGSSFETDYNHMGEVYGTIVADQTTDGYGYKIYSYQVQLKDSDEVKTFTEKSVLDFFIQNYSYTIVEPEAVEINGMQLYPMVLADEGKIWNAPFTVDVSDDAETVYVEDYTDPYSHPVYNKNGEIIVNEGECQGWVTYLNNYLVWGVIVPVQVDENSYRNDLYLNKTCMAEMLANQYTDGIYPVEAPSGSYLYDYIEVENVDGDIFNFETVDIDQAEKFYTWQCPSTAWSDIIFESDGSTFLNMVYDVKTIELNGVTLYGVVCPTTDGEGNRYFFSRETIKRYQETLETVEAPDDAVEAPDEE
jgi:hypothetical protein